jgi:hypothetical protein
VRRAYIHEKCGTLTTMAERLAETYARDPKFYGATAPHTASVARLTSQSARTAI